MTLPLPRAWNFSWFLSGMEEGLFPHKMWTILPAWKRSCLCYVGSRAGVKLYMSYAESRRMHGDVTLCRPSRFIREVPSDLVEEVRLKTTVNRAHAPARGSH